MPSWLPPLIPALPLLACLVTLALGSRVLRARSHWPCVAAAALSFLLSVVYLLVVLTADDHASSARDVVELYDWIVIGDAESLLFIRAPIAFQVDELSAIMVVTVTLVGLLVAIYSIGYLHGDPGYGRFFAEIALFIFSMVMLVLAGNFLLLYIFWEAVGLCSYLLIGFWYQKPEAASAGKKAFLVNRIGDFGFALGVFLIWKKFDSLDYATVFHAQAIGGVDSGTLVIICLLLFSGAIGKSAQFPLHVWLPDAMEGPTPVSALIHAATMVTAGVYLVARCTPLFVASGWAPLAVACIGGFTALLAALIALTQNDLKRVLAYSTISQLGYMFVGLGVGSVGGVVAGMFHLFTHAFFKALLFLGAGSVMHAMGGVIDMTRFGGLRRRLPRTCWTFAVGAAALAGFPLLSGFWSKDAILTALHEAAGNAAAVGTWAGGIYRVLFWVLALTAFLTAFYVFRAFFKTFWGEEVIPEQAVGHAQESPPVMTVPLVVLAVASLVIGLVFGPTGWFKSILSPAFAAQPAFEAAQVEHGHSYFVAGLSALVALVGIAVAYWFYGQPSTAPATLAKKLGPLYRWSYRKFYVDELYEGVIVMPVRVLAWICRGADGLLVDGLVNLVAQIPLWFGRFGAVMQNGLVQFYALAMLMGLAVLMLILLGA